MKKKPKMKSMALSILLTLAMVVGLMPGMSLTAYADNTETPLTTIKATAEGPAYSTENVATVSFTGTIDYDRGGWTAMSGSITVNAAEGYTITKCVFHNENSDVTDENAPFITEFFRRYPVTKSIDVYGHANKTAQTVTPPTASTDLTYKKDQAQALLTSGASVTTGNTATGSIQYKVGTDGTWSTEIPKGTNAGTYSVYYKVLGNDTYAEYASTDPISVTIAKADPVTLLENAYNAKYGQQAKDITLPTGWSWADPEKKFEKTGEVDLTANFAESDNYFAKTKSIPVMVVKAAAKISYATGEVTKELNSEDFTNPITNTGDITPTFTSSKTSVATVDGTGSVTIKGIGETTITANVAEDNDHYTYETRNASYKLTVNPISTEISTAPTAAEITYGQKLSDSTLTGGEAKAAGSSGTTVEGTFAWKEPDKVPNASDNGQYDVVFTPTDTTNYAESTGKVTIKVNKAAAPATKESLLPEQKPAAKNADDLVYTGEPIKLVTAPANPLGGYKVQYSKDNGTTWTDTIPTETNVGTYTVKVKYVSDNYENIDLDDITVTITSADKKALTDAIAAAKAYYDTIKGNTDYSEAADRLDKAIKAAEEVAAKDKVTKAEVNTAAEAVNTAKTIAETEVKDVDDAKAAQAVSNKIAALPAKNDVTIENKAAIDEARAAYNALTEDQKAKVTPETLKKLTDAEAALDAAEVENVVDKINKLPSSDKVTLTDKESIEAARKAYNALTEDQKAKVSADTLKKLTDDEAALKEAEMKAVKSVTVNAITVNAKSVKAAVAKAGGDSRYVQTIVIGSKVKKIKKGTFKNFKSAKTLIVKSKKLKKASVRKSLKGSKITRVKVQVGKKKTNKKYVRKYKRIFTKKNAGKKVKVTR